MATASNAKAEPLLQRGPAQNKYILFPIQYPSVWKMYKQAEAAFWTTSELDFEADVADWQALPAQVQHYVSTVLGFFASADMLVVNNLLSDVHFSSVEVGEVKAFYAFQAAVESIHSECYATLIDTYIREEGKRDRLLHAITEIPAIRAKQAWAESFTNNPARSFAEKLVGFATFEGLLFAASFASIFWLKSQYNGKLVGLTTSNELIARDESLHCDFACHLYKEFIVNKLTDAQVHAIVKSAVSTEHAFVRECLPDDLVGMNHRMMNEYVDFQANRLCRALGHAEPYPAAAQPFPWMETIGLMGKSNFFEKRTTEYARPTEALQVGAGFEDVDF